MNGKASFGAFFGVVVQDVVDDTRRFVESVTDTFRSHLGKVFPKVNVDVDVEVEEPDKE